MELSEFERLIARITSTNFVQDKKERRGPTGYLDYRSGPYNRGKHTRISGRPPKRELTGITPMIKIA